MRRLLATLTAAFLWAFAPANAWADVNINTATASQLESLPGIGPAKASAIVQYRTDHGAFASVNQLDNVPGIGPATLANLNGLVSVGDGATVAQGAAAAPAASGADASSHKASGAAPAGGKININTASAGQLEDLPGIGPAKAAAIVSYRDQAGQFSRCEDLDKVEGIGPATVSALLDSCTVGDSGVAFSGTR